MIARDVSASGCIAGFASGEASAFTYHTTAAASSVLIYVFFFFSSSHLFTFALFLFSLSPFLDVTQIQVRVTKQDLLPPPHYDACLLFYREKTWSPTHRFRR